MSAFTRRARRGGAVAVLAVLCACGGTNKGESSPATYTVRGSVTGLAGTGLVLRNAGGDDLAIAADGPFAFTTALAAGARYAVTVETQPGGPAQTCTVANGVGTVGGADVTGVAVTCSTRSFAVRGIVTGLRGTGLALRNNGGDDLPVLANGSFTFAATVPSGQTFAVTVAAQPSGPTQTCTVTRGSGTVGTDDVADVAVNCETQAFAVSGTVTGLQGSGLTLALDGGDDLPITVDGPFTFPAHVASGEDYWVLVRTQPHLPEQICIVQGAVGVVADTDVTGVEVVCTAKPFRIAGTVSGLAGSGLVLQNNGADDLALGANARFVFTAPVGSGNAYAVTVRTNPSGPTQACEVVNGTGTVGDGDVTTVQVACTTRSFRVAGTVSGLKGSGLVLRDNLGETVSPTSNGSFAFATPILSGQPYAVTVTTSPSLPSQVCTVANGSGVIGGADTAVAVTCTNTPYRIQGTVTGLAGTGLVLQNNGRDDLSVTANGVFTFATSIPSGDTYAVTVRTPPSSPTQLCTVGRGTGTVLSSDVTDVAVVCASEGHAVRGAVTGLVGTGLTLRNNGGDDLAITASGPFAFATPIATGAAYAVTVAASPGGQTCTANRGAGTMPGADVTDVAVICSAQSVRVGGAVTGFKGGGLVLQDNNGDDLLIDADGAFTFATPVAQGADYVVTVRSQPVAPPQLCTIANGSGTTGAADVTNVAVSCHGWALAQLLETSNYAVASPRIAADAAGNVIAVWLQTDGTAASVYANRYTAGTGWGTAELLETGRGIAAAPRVAMNAAGYALAVWHQRPSSGSRNDIWVNRYTPGTGWGAAELIESDTVNTAGNAAIALDNSGNGLAVWQQTDGNRFNIWANRYTAGSGWGTPELIETDNAGAATVPQIAVDPASGIAFAIWPQSDGTRTNIVSNRYVPGAGWGTAQLIETESTGATVPQIAVDGSGNAIAVWVQYDGVQNAIWANRFAGGSWGTAALVETNDASAASVPQLAIDPGGNAIAVWVESNSIWANRYAAGSGWGTAQLLETDDVGNAAAPQIGCDASGNTVAVWQQNDGSRNNIWSNLYTPASGWGLRVLVEAATGDASAPAVAVGSSGRPFAVWIQGDGTANSIFASDYE